MTFGIIIKPVGQLTAMEKSRMSEVERICFEGEESGIEWSPSDWVVLGLLDGMIVSQICVLEREVDVGGEKIRVGGVGGVATHPDYRQKGYAGKLLQASEQFFHELDLPFGVLVCGEEKRPYYASFGWVKIENRTIFQNEGQDREMDGTMMILPLKEFTWPDGLLNLNGKPW
ncbi:MAG TPA: GNAT family N-acetyltransferase [Levilinea sp.]|nr:GNAT family N-acetyltransferase [Levilinea sp.]